MLPDLDDVPDELDGELAGADDALDDAPDILDDLAFDAAYEIPAGEMPTAEQTAAEVGAGSRCLFSGVKRT